MLGGWIHLNKLGIGIMISESISSHIFLKSWEEHNKILKVNLIKSYYINLF